MTKKASKVSSFFSNPYQFLDAHDPQILGFHFNIFRSDIKLRRAFIIPIVVALIMWMIMGWDSSDQQIWDALWALTSGAGIEAATIAYVSAYGCFQHWSAYVIYGLMYIGISKHLRSIGLENSENIVYSICFTLFSVGVFEYFWNIAYYVFQGQHWVLSFQMPQLRILMQNMVFLALGVMRLANINWKVVKLNLSRETLFYLMLALVFAELWIVYGDYFPVQTLTVQTVRGPWISSKLFPQTVYTVQEDFSMAVGIQYYVSDNWIHLINLLSKATITLCIYSLFKLKRR